MSIQPTTTIKEAKEWLIKSAQDGVKCPCCSQHVKIYKRPLNSSMARVLIHIYRHFETGRKDWLHVPSFLSKKGVGAGSRGGDWSKLRYWGLIKSDESVRNDGSKRSGYYKLTNLGVEFALSQVEVLSHAYVYNGKLLRLGGDPVFIQDVLGKKFNYQELMSGK